MMGGTDLARLEEPAQPVDFEGFFREHYATLARALLLLTRDPGAAENLAQEAMARVYERWDRVAAMDSPDGYLYRTAMNLNRKRLRRLAVRARRVFAATPDRDALAAVEDRNQVLDMLGTLPEGQREALVLVDWLGLETEEAARVLGIAAVSVRSRLHRGRSALRERFGGRDE